MSSVKNFFKSLVEFIGLLGIVFIVRTFVFGLYIVPTGSMETTLLRGEQLAADKLTYWFRNPDYGEIIACNEPVFKYSENKYKNLFERYFSLGIENWTKRVIGKPGDTIKGVIEDGHPVIYRNGVKLVEPYINKYPLVYVASDLPKYFNKNTRVSAPTTFDPNLPGDKQMFYKIDTRKIIDFESENLLPGTPLKDGHDEYELTLKDNEYWILGDNRLGSRDSRYFGPVNIKLIHGRIIFRLFSFDKYDIDTTRRGISSLLYIPDWTIFKLVVHPIDFINNVRWSRCFQFVK